MPCAKCGATLILNPAMDSFCPSCNPPENCRVFSRTETKKWFHLFLHQYKEKIRAQLDQVNTEQLLIELNSQRDAIAITDPLGFLTITRGMSLVLDNFCKAGSASKISLTLNLIKNICNDFRTYYQHEVLVYHASLDRWRIAHYDDDSLYKTGDVPKFTEYWFPIFARMFILGILPSDRKPKSDIHLALWGSYELRKTIIERLEDSMGIGNEMNRYIQWTQNLRLQHPERLYPLRPEGKAQLPQEFHSSLAHLLGENTTILPIEWQTFQQQISKATMEIILLNTATAGSNRKVPLFVEDPVSGNILIPTQFIRYLIRANEALHNPKGREFNRRYGLMYEEYTLDAIKSFNVQCHDQENRPFLHYKNCKIHPSDELFDVGFYSPQLKKFYICELKSILRIQVTEVLDYEAEMEQNFQKFRDRDVPRMNAKLDVLGLSGYTLQPIFMTLGPSFDNRHHLMEYVTRDGIIVTHSIAGICASLVMDLQGAKISFDDTFSVPQVFWDVIQSSNLRAAMVDPRITDCDIHNLDNRIAVDAAHIRLGKVMDAEMSEIDVQILKEPFRGVILCIDIPPIIREKVKNLDLQKQEVVKIAFYRGFPHSMVCVLGDIVKI